MISWFDHGKLHDICSTSNFNFKNYVKNSTIFDKNEKGHFKNFKKDGMRKVQSMSKVKEGKNQKH